MTLVSGVQIIPLQHHLVILYILQTNIPRPHHDSSCGLLLGQIQQGPPSEGSGESREVWKIVNRYQLNF